MATDEGNEAGLVPPLEKAGLHPWRWEVEAGRSHLQGAHDNEDDIASKSDDTSECNLLSLLTESEENEELNEFINNNMDRNKSDSNGVLLS